MIWAEALGPRSAASDGLSPPHAQVESPTQMDVELVSESPMGLSPRPRCVRSGCDNPPVSSSDWDNEYCSSECVVKHCR